jgi:uncharacterized protein YjcR
MIGLMDDEQIWYDANAQQIERAFKLWWSQRSIEQWHYESCKMDFILGQYEQSKGKL